MTIEKKQDGFGLELVLSGRLDTITAPELEAELKQISEDVTEIVFDFTGLDYISSAGLRVLLSEQKVMNKRGKMSVKNVNKVVREVFEVTGFTNILTII